MSSDNSLAASPSLDANPQENEEKRTILKDSNQKKPRKVPAKVRAACLTYHPPFCREVYNHFISAIKYGEPAYPSSKELAKLGFYTTLKGSYRKKFREILPRLGINVVEGSVVFSSNPQEEVLVHKKSGKILVPTDIIEQVVRRAHLTGSNEANEESLDETKCSHFNVRHTWMILSKRFTVNRREFGIDMSIIYNFIAQCRFCNVPPFPVAKGMTQQIQFNNSNFDKASKNNKESEEKETAALEESDDENGLKPPSVTARFCSMAAHIPDKKCIWYDRKCFSEDGSVIELKHCTSNYGSSHALVQPSADAFRLDSSLAIADTTNRYDKLVMVLGEMRGEMGLAVKGNAEAKQRLEAKLYCAQLLIKEHIDSIQQSLIFEDSPKLFGTELSDLKEEYKRTGQSSLFRSDITGLLAHLKSHKLVISPLLVQEIEDFLKQQIDNTDCAQDKVR